MKSCNGCWFRVTYGTCDFIGFTGRARQILFPGDKLKCKVTSEEEYKKMIRKVCKPGWHKAMRSELTDQQCADTLFTTLNAVQLYRRIMRKERRTCGSQRKSLRG